MAMFVQSVVREYRLCLVIELYDFSSEAEKWLGNEVAFLLKVFPGDKSKMLCRLLEGQKQMLDESQEDDLLLQLIAERFTDYYDVKQWMEENKIPYEQSLIRGHEVPGSVGG